MKALMKRLLPESALAWLRGCESDMKLRRENPSPDEAVPPQLRKTRLHAQKSSGKLGSYSLPIRLKKGLSHTDFRYGFGKKVLAQMAPLMETLRTTDPGHRT